MTKTEKLKRGDLKQALIDYAMNAADEGHVETMSLRKAARDLGVSSGAVYRHFPDKDALLMEVTHMGFTNLRDIFTAIRPKDAPANSLEQAKSRSYEMVSAYIRFALARPALWRMMFGRIGIMCRDNTSPEDREYTPLDITGGNLMDFYRLGGIETEPTISDVRYIWSATHGAADLAQSGARLDADQLDAVIQQTVDRNLRSIGVQRDLINSP